jgi:DNA-binding NtrC family response regulator
VKQLNARLGKQIQSIPQKSLEALMNYAWPGNIRELRNVIERATIITPGNSLLLRDSLEAGPPGQQVNHLAGTQNGIVDRSQTLEESERNLILRTLDRTGGRIEGPAGAATLLGIHPSTLRSRMRKLGIARSRLMIQGSGG